MLAFFILLIFRLVLTVQGYHRGAVIALIKGTTNDDFSELIKRNKSILKFLWSNETAVDIVLFHENSLSNDVKVFIQSAVPDMPLIFVEVEFDNHAIFEDPSNSTVKVLYPLCHASAMSNMFRIGYKNMCRFWFIGFLDYVREYDWVFRLDPDCELLDDVRAILPEPNHVLVSSPGWQPLHRLRWDRVATTKDGDVVLGMGPFVRTFAERYGLNHSFIDSMYAPYTNAMYINIRWLMSSETVVHSAHTLSDTTEDHLKKRTHSAKVIREFMKEVDESNCIYSNRWGDFPLWGAALSLIDYPVRFLRTPYYHGSHNVMISDQSRTGQYRNDIQLMLVYADNVNVTINSRISVNG